MNETIASAGEIPANQVQSKVSESFPYIACFCAALVFAGLTIRDLWRQHQIGAQAIEKMVVPNIKATTLLAGRNQFLGDTKAPYTLVEFGDYECPPCRHTQPLVASALAKYKGRVKLDFRQFPIVSLHPHAMEAALAAESGRASGKFWDLHERLFTANLREKSAVAQSLTATGVILDRMMATKQIAMDSALIMRLSVSSTPSFLLCRPDGSIVRLPNVQAIDQFVK